ncbi:MAG: hypothetical protein WCJ44_24930 [Runella sp.]
MPSPVKGFMAKSSIDKNWVADIFLGASLALIAMTFRTSCRLINL